MISWREAGIYIFLYVHVGLMVGMAGVHTAHGGGALDADYCLQHTCQTSIGINVAIWLYWGVATLHDIFVAIYFCLTLSPVSLTRMSPT